MARSSSAGPYASREYDFAASDQVHRLREISTEPAARPDLEQTLREDGNDGFGDRRGELEHIVDAGHHPRGERTARSSVARKPGES
jgi:hypothetical protein